MELIRKFLSHDAGPVAQFFKYAISGGIATGVQILVFFITGWLLFPCLTESDPVVKLLVRFFDFTIPEPSASRAFNAFVCSTIGFLLANVVCYFLNRIFVFKAGRHHPAVEFLLFLAVSGISLGIGTAIQTWLISGYSIETSVAFGANLVSSLAINYAARRFFIFNG